MAAKEMEKEGRNSELTWRNSNGWPEGRETDLFGLAYATIVFLIGKFEIYVFQIDLNYSLLLVH